MAMWPLRPRPRMQMSIGPFFASHWDMACIRVEDQLHRFCSRESGKEPIDKGVKSLVWRS